MSSRNYYHLPDLHALCPWKAAFNPHNDAVGHASREWVLSYPHDAEQAMDKLKFFEQCGPELLASWGYPYAGPEELRTCCDFVNLLFTIDEISDLQNGKEAATTATCVIRSMTEDDYDDGSILCHMTRDFKARFVMRAGPATARRFIEHVADYVTSVTEEAGLREKNIVLDLESYDTIRRDNSAVRTAFGLFGYVLGHDLPDEIFYHPVYMDMYLAAVDMVTWANDLYSYDMEQAMGHTTNNVLTVLMREKGMTLQEAADYVGYHFKELVDKFESGKSRLPSFGTYLDEIVAFHVHAMQYWVIGNLDWSFGSQRYFGRNHQQVKESLVVKLSPRKV